MRQRFRNRGSSRRGRAKTFFGGPSTTLGAGKGLGVPGGGPSRFAPTLDNRKGWSLRDSPHLLVREGTGSTFGPVPSFSDTREFADTFIAFRVTQFPQGLHLDLTNTLTGEMEDATHFI